MKKNLLMMVFGVALIQTSYAQDYLIEVMGGSAVGNPMPEVIISDYQDVAKVEAEAIYFYATPDPVPAPGNVNFFNNGVAYEASFNLVDPHHGGGNPDNPNHKGYYRRTIQPLAASKVILDKTDLTSTLNLGDKIDAFYTYVFREGGNCEYSLTDPEQTPAYLYKKGEDFTADAAFPLKPATGLRDIVIAIPFTDNENIVADSREGVVKISGTNLPVQADVHFALNSGTTNFNILEIPISGIQPDVTDITVKVYSPADNGDSFIAGTMVLTVKEECNEGGCTLTQGYWKTHSQDGPASKPDATWDQLTNSQNTIFYNTGMSWLEVFNTPVQGNAYYNLAHQYMAAYLNTLAGASVPSMVEDAMQAAHAIFSTNGPEYYEKEKGKTEASKEEVAELISLANLLTQYNEGEIGPGHCDDLEELEKSAKLKLNTDEFSDISVYPNPVTSFSTISFRPKISGRVTVDLYNSVGQRITRLMDRNVQEGIPVNLKLSNQDYNEGLYILRIQDGNRITTSKIQIIR